MERQFRGEYFSFPMLLRKGGEAVRRGILFISHAFEEGRGRQFGGEYFSFPKLLRKGGGGSLEGNTFHFPCS